MGYSGNMYAQATEVITSQGDLRRGDSSGNPERLAIGSSGKVLQSNGTTESWETLSLADSVLTTQGDILYQGASAMARLGQSTDGYVLTTKGAAANPVWAAAAGGGSLALVGSDVVTGGATSTLTVSFTAIPASEVAYLMGVFSMDVDTTAEAQPTLLRVNSLSTSTYDFDTFNISGGSEIISSNTGESAWRVANDANNGERYGIFYVSLNRVSDKIQMVCDSSGELGTQWQGGYNTTSSQTTYTKIELAIGAGRFIEDSRLDVYRCNI